MGETENLRHCIEKGPQLLNACDLEMQPEDAHALMELLIVHDPSTCATQAWIRCCPCSPLGHWESLAPREDLQDAKLHKMFSAFWRLQKLYSRFCSLRQPVWFHLQARRTSNVLRWVVTCGNLLRPCAFPVRSGFGLVAGDVQRAVMAYHQCLRLLTRILKGDTGERAMRVRSI